MDTDTNSSNSLKSKWYQPLILKAKDYEFNEPVSKSDKEFWQGVGAKIYDDDEEIKRTQGPLKCILHVNTNLIITYEGKLIGRQTDDGIVYIEDLDPKIIQWYMNCGF
jgi:predicted cobalt transporter CbtA